MISGVHGSPKWPGRPILFLIGSGVLLAAVWVLRRTEDRPPVARRPSPPTVPEVVPRPLEELRPALQAGERPAKIEAARSLRKSLLAFPDRMKEAIRFLRDPGAPVELRRSMAVVLGSLPGRLGKRALLESLRDRTVEGLERTVILALGSIEFEDGREFERDDQPNAVWAAPGMAVFVLGPLGDPEARAELDGHLTGSQAEERRAAARVLRDSTGFPEVRKAFLDRLGAETDGETAAEEAAALATWTGKAPSGDAERGATMGRVLDLLPASDEIVRFRLTSPLSSLELLPAEADRLRGIASSGDADTRHFAMSVLGRRLGISGEEDRTALPILILATAQDPEAEVRAVAALGLGRVSKEPQVLGALTTALGADPVWEVRAAAARALSGAGPSARAALQLAAQSDSHPDVRVAAERALK
jgi:HEAT repeat protein